MRAVNLIPGDYGRHSAGASVGRLGAAHALIGLLVLALAVVLLYVFTGNTISQRRAELVTLHQQVAQARSQAGSLTDYAKFEQLAQKRADTVRELAAARFDWASALSDLAKVMPANASLQSLSATVAPNVSAAGSSSSSSSGVRADIDAPAFVLAGCTSSQDDVAQLMSRLRLINNVTRVTLDSSAAGNGQGGVSSVSGGGGCSADGPSFNIVVFFSPLSAAATSLLSTSGGTP